MTESNIHLYPDFEEITAKGGLFDVGPNELDDDIGRLCLFTDRAQMAPAYRYLQKVVAVQQDYKGRLCYRVQIAEDTPMLAADRDLGRVARPEAIEFVDFPGR